jgi:glycosyltransferase involved in cell wall biosynthesis
MAIGKPILTNVDGELREIMEQHNTGLYFSLQEPGSLKRAIETLTSSPDKRREMGENGRKLVAARFLRSKITADAVKLIEDQLKF